MPLPLLIGLTALALIQLAAMVSFFIWPDSVETIGMVAMIGTALIFLGWMGVIFYELKTGKRVGRL